MVRNRSNDRYALVKSPLIKCILMTIRSRATFLVFDCIAINGKNYSKENLTDRLKRIRDLVVVPYRSAIENGIIDKVYTPYSFSSLLIRVGLTMVSCRTHTPSSSSESSSSKRSGRVRCLSRFAKSAPTAAMVLHPSLTGQLCVDSAA